MTVSEDSLINFDRVAYQKRLRLIRLLEGFKNQARFAAFIGIGYKKWNHYESSGYPLSRESAFLLHSKLPNYPIEWIWWGETKGLAVGTLERIRALETQERKNKNTITPAIMSKIRTRVSKIDRDKRQSSFRPSRKA